MTRLVDMHMHAGFTGNPARFARELGDNGIDVFANTVTPQEFKRLFPLLHGESSMRLGLGLHPWWIGSSELGPLDEVLAVFEHELQSTRFVGEIGLDLWPSHAFTKDFQIEALVRIAKLCAMRGGISSLCMRSRPSASCSTFSRIPTACGTAPAFCIRMAARQINSCELSRMVASSPSARACSRQSAVVNTRALCLQNGCSLKAICHPHQVHLRPLVM